MLIDEKNITRIIAFGPLLFIPSVVIVLALMVINSHMLVYEKNIQRMELELQESEKKAVQTKVENAVDLVMYQNSVIKEKLLSRVKMRVDNAHEIATSIYQKYKETKTDQEIQDIIITSLRPLYWNNSESFIWILDYKGVFYLAPKYLRHLEGTSILNFQDANKRYVIQEEIALCKEKGEGFIWDTFTKPSDATGKLYEQVAYVKAFGMYAWYLGSSEYLDTASKKSDKEILEYISKIDIRNDRYIFILKQNGEVLLNEQNSGLIGQNLFSTANQELQKVGNIIQEALKDKDKGFISYEWVNPATQKSERKYSYISKVQNSDWIIGSGFHDATVKNIVQLKSDELYSDYLQEFKNILFLSLLMIVVSSLVSYFISRYIKRSYIKYHHKINSKTKELQRVNASLEERVSQRTSELVQQKSILHHQANHDSLTKLPNRALFGDRLLQGIEKAKRNRTNMALMFIDLDRFKQINDSLGHNIGDEVLKEVTNRLLSKIRNEDTLARLGGDEFTIIMQSLIKIEDASVLAQKIIDALTEPIVVETHVLYVSSSIGISLYPQDSSDTHDLLKYADAAMYKAKDEGRNNFQFYASEMTESAMSRVHLEANLRDAIKNEEFIVYYQPKVNVQTDKLIGMEALIRWNHPKKGLLTPAHFLSLALETGMIVQIDRIVMGMAMKQVAEWHEAGLNPGVLSINLAMKQLEGTECIEVLCKNMEAVHFKPEWLELEVTEGEVMKKPEDAIDTLKKISNLGIHISVDDFGTGYSSLSYLKRLPLNTLKIDRSFVMDTPDDEEDVAIVKSIIALAKSLNLNIIAEGVETREQSDFLAANGCVSMQGYFYSKPLSPAEMEAFLLKIKA